MPRTKVIFYKEGEEVPLLDCLAELQKKPRAKCVERIERLEELGHEIRRPEADFLRDGIYELRVRWQKVNYRMLYFFHGNQAVVISHGLVKEAKVPPKEIDLALKRKGRFEQNPKRHTFNPEDQSNAQEETN